MDIEISFIWDQTQEAELCRLKASIRRFPASVHWISYRDIETCRQTIGGTHRTALVWSRL